MDEQQWLECKIGEGMFSNECSLSVEATEIDVSFFFTPGTDSSIRIILGKDGKTRLEVTALERDNDHTLVLLPRATIEAGNCVRVKNEFLKSREVTK